MVKHPHVKGNAVELEARRILGNWAGQPFHKMPKSGGLRWAGKIFTFGDVIPPEEYRMIIEVKGRPGPKDKSKVGVIIDNIFTSKVNKTGDQINYWWSKQLWSDLSRAEALYEKPFFPMLMIKINLRGWRVCVEEAAVESLADLQNVTNLTIRRENHEFRMYEAQSFFKAITPDRLLEAYHDNR